MKRPYLTQWDRGTLHLHRSEVYKTTKGAFLELELAKKKFLRSIKRVICKK